MCVCLRARSACTRPLLAGVCGVGVCAWARAWAAPCLSWLEFWGLCVFVCGVCLYPAIPGWGVLCGCVCLGSCFGCPPPLLAGVLGCVCVFGRGPLVPCHSWLGCWGVCVGVHPLLLPDHSSLGFAVWVCVLGLEVCLRPACPGRGVGVCVCLCARSACTLPLLGGLCSVGVCASAQVSAAPCLSWLGCCGFCVFVCTLLLYPATPGWRVRCGCVCLRLNFGRALPLLAGVLGCLCVCGPAPLVPRHSWLGCAVWPCVLALGFWLRPATPGWGVAVCVCVFGRAPLVPRHSWLACWGVCVGVHPLLVPCRFLAEVCRVGVSALARVSAAPRLSWLGCWGVCLFVCAVRVYPATHGWGVRCGCLCLGSGFGCPPPHLAGVFGCVSPCAPSACTAPLLARVCGVWIWCCLAPVPVPWFVAGCARCLSLRHPVAVDAWHLSVCLGCGRQRASVACLVALLWCAAPRPVWSLSVLWSAFLTLWCLSASRGPAPANLLRLHRARGGRPKTELFMPAAGRCRGSGPGLPPRRIRSGPCDGAVPGGSLQSRFWAACATVVSRVWTWSLTRPIFRTARLSTGDSAGAPGLFRVDADTAPFGSKDATPGSRACVRVPAPLGWVGRAGLPGAFWCASSFPVAGLGALFVCSAPSGLRLPLFLFSFFSFFFPFVRPRCLWRSVLSGPGGLGPWRLVVPPAPPSSPPSFFFSFPPSPPPPVCFGFPPCLLSCVLCFFLFSFFFFAHLCFFFLSCCAPPRGLGRSVFSGPGCLGPLRLIVPPRPFFFSSSSFPPPSSLFFFCLLFLCFLFFFCFFGSPPPFFAFFPVPALPVVRCGGGLCVVGCGVCLCVLRWCCACRCSLRGALPPLWRWLVLCVVACCVWVFAVGPGCPLLSPGGSWCRVSVVLSLSARVACRPVVCCGVSRCSAALCCVVWRCAAVWWCAVVLCCLIASLHVPVVCLLPLRVCCVCCGVSCCAFPVLSALCGAGALVLCCSRGLRCFWRLVLLVPGVVACFWRSACGSGCLVLSFGGVFRR